MKTWENAAIVILWIIVFIIGLALLRFQILTWAKVWGW